MPKYRVYGIVKANKFIGEFEARNAEHAENLAWSSDESDVSICYHCSEEIIEPEITEMIVEEIEED